MCRMITFRQGWGLHFQLKQDSSLFEDPPYHGTDATSLTACANGFIDGATNLSAEIDGRPIKRIEQYRIRSPLFTVGPVPNPNILGAPPGTTTQSVDAGVYLLVLPLKPGHHTIHFKGIVAGGAIDTKYNIVVTP